MDKSYFVERFNKSIKEKAVKEFVLNILIDNDLDFVLLAPPPAKDKDIITITTF